jgi:hypothetical protein
VAEGELEPDRTASSVEPPEEKPAGQGRRGRGRGRSRKARKTEEPTEATLVEEDTEEVEPPAADTDDDSDEVDNLSDWNVPSWQELIASLYRPER